VIALLGSIEINLKLLLRFFILDDCSIKNTSAEGLAGLEGEGEAGQEG
jgi:hypothetical protein